MLLTASYYIRTRTAYYYDFYFHQNSETNSHSHRQKAHCSQRAALAAEALTWSLQCKGSTRS